MSLMRHAMAGMPVIVYLVNGDTSLIGRGAKPRSRKVIRYKGIWCIRDHGRIPIRGKTDDGAYFT